MLTDLQLLPSQKNALFKLVQDSGINPNDIEYEEYQYRKRLKSLKVPRLVHVSRAFWFRVDCDDLSGFVCTYTPSPETYQPQERMIVNWAGVLTAANEWMGLLKREIETHDLWAALPTERLFQSSGSEETSDNNPFTPAELSEVRKCLKEIKAHVMKVTTLTMAQTKIVEARFEHMEEAATRMGRKDWFSLVIGSLVGVVTSLSLDGPSTRDIFGFAALALKKVLGTVMYLASPH